MVGMASVVTKDVPPFLKVLGSPLRLMGVNSVGLQRTGFTEEVIRDIVASYENSELPELSDKEGQSFIEAFRRRRATSTRQMIALHR